VSDFLPNLTMLFKVCSDSFLVLNTYLVILPSVEACRDLAVNPKTQRFTEAGFQEILSAGNGEEEQHHSLAPTPSQSSFVKPCHCVSRERLACLWQEE
jgi:hypothetical protein